MTSSSTRGKEEEEEGGMVVVSERTRERGARHFSDDEADVVRKREFNFYQRASSRAGGRGRRKRKGKGGGGRIPFRAKNDGKSFLFSLFWVVFFFIVVVSPASWSEVRGETTTTTTTTTTLAERLDACALNLLDDVNSTVNSNFNTRLEGLTLSVAAIWDPGYVSIEGEAAPTRTKDYPDVYCTDCGSRLSGYNFDVFEKMASLGNFKTNWTIFGDVDSSRGETYEQMALNFTRDFDVSGQWWSDTARRRSIGVSCGYYHTDVTRMLTVLETTGSDTFSLFMLFAPFQSYIWLVLFAAFLLVSTALVYIEHDCSIDSKQVNFKDELCRSLWNTWCRFACGGDAHDPRTHLGQLVQGSYGFLRLIVVALYGASLTSILIEDANTSGTIKTMTELREAGGRAIMFAGDPLKSRILAQNPWLVAEDVPRGEILSTTDFRALLDKYNSVAVILSSPDALTVAQNSDLCDIVVTGVAISAGGGFITSYDDCLSDLNLIFDSLLMTMESDGTLDYITASYANKKCTSVIETESAKSKYQVGLFRISGIFVLGSCVLAGVSVLSGLQKVARCAASKSRSEEGEQTER